MKQTRKPKARVVSELALQPNEVALVERFRRLKDTQKSFASRVIDLLISNDSARPRRNMLC